jgi:hypothetical protein
MNNNNNTEIATVANGCFWCSEAIFKRLKGIKSVLPGYAGGIVKNPSYDQVCTGKTQLLYRFSTYTLIMIILYLVLYTSCIIGLNHFLTVMWD